MEDIYENDQMVPCILSNSFPCKMFVSQEYEREKVQRIEYICRSMKICTKVVRICSVSCLLYYYGLYRTFSSSLLQKRRYGFVFAFSSLIHSLVALIVNARLRLLPQKFLFIAYILCTTVFPCFVLNHFESFDGFLERLHNISILL